ncbi:unnamed protein product, partial [Allacma fusca]
VLVQTLIPIVLSKPKTTSERTSHGEDLMKNLLKVIKDIRSEEDDTWWGGNIGGSNVSKGSTIIGKQGGGSISTKLQQGNEQAEVTRCRDLDCCQVFRCSGGCCTCNSDMENDPLMSNIY